LRAANFLTTKCLPTRKPSRSTNIDTNMIVSSRRLRSTSMHHRFLYRLQSHLGNFAHNIGQRIVLNHAIVYNDSTRWYSWVHSPHNLILRARPQLRSDRFVLLKAIDNYEWTIMLKRRDSLIRLEIIVSAIIFTETCVRIVENRLSVFIEIQNHIIVRITF